MPEHTFSATDDESLRRTQAMLDQELSIGRGIHTNQPRFLHPAQYLQTAIHLIGRPGSGKSRLIEHLAQNLARFDIPTSVIDIHRNNIARPYLAWLQRQPRLVRERKIVHFEPGSPSCALGFDPFRCGVGDAGAVASIVLQAILKVWGAGSSDATPRLERILGLVLEVLAANNVALTQAQEFLQPRNAAFRNRLLERAGEKTRTEWEDIERLPASVKAERLESSGNRIQRFTRLPAVRRFLEHRNSLDFSQMYRRRQTLVADLSTLHSDEERAITGALLVNAMYHAAKRRPEENPAPWFMAIDEFPQFVTTDIARSLDELRKFGVRLILSHQHLGQIEDKQLLGAIMTSAKIKFIMAGLSREDAEILARELFTGDIRGDRVKHISYATKFRPILEAIDIDSDMEAVSEGGSRGRNRSRGSSWQDSQTSSWSTDATLSNALGSTYSVGARWGSNDGLSDSEAENFARTSARTVTHAFVTRHQEFLEETSRQFWSLDEEWEKAISRIMLLNNREALVKVFNAPVIDIQTPELAHLPARFWLPSALTPQGRALRAEIMKQRAKVVLPPNPTTPAKSDDDLPPDFHE